MEHIGKINDETKKYLFDIPLHQWSLYHDVMFHYESKDYQMKGT